jgi:nucleotide-binding universal stress UspA family protein
MAATRGSMSNALPAEARQSRLQLRRILCPIDFSDTSRRALEYGVAIARWYKAELAALYVGPAIVQPVNLAEYPAPMPLEPPRETLMRDLEQMLGAAEAQDLRTTVAIEHGGAVQQILKLAEALPADLIVLGTHGRGGFERLMLGSGADKVVRKAVCPVITVPRAAEEASASARFSRIVCATDFSEGSRAALSWALAFAGTPDARLTLVHVLDWPDVPEEGEPFASTLTEARDRWLEQLRRRVHEALPAEARSGVTVEEVLATGTPYKEILQAAAERRADLIVMGVHGRGALDLRLFGSTTSEVLRRAACSVLTVRAAG